jgi:hypothetical protein
MSKPNLQSELVRERTFCPTIGMSALPRNVLQNYFEGLLAKH